MSKRDTSLGFSVVEALLILIVIGILGFTGWYVYHAKQVSDKSYSSAGKSNIPDYKRKSNSSTASTDTSNPYAGWDGYTTKYEKVSFSYPPTWTITDKSGTASDCVSPGSDFVVLTSPTNEQILLNAGVDCIGDAGSTTFGSTPIKALGQNAYIAYENDDTPNGPKPTFPDYACLAPTASPTTPLAFPSVNVHSTNKDGTPHDSFCYYPYYYLSPHAASHVESVSSIENSKDFATARLIFESMKY